MKNPASYLNEAWLDKLPRLEAALDGRFAFAVQADTHFFDIESDKQLYNLKALAHLYPLDFIANLGDMIRGYFKDKEGNTPEKMQAAMDELSMRYTTDAPCPVLLTIGNHDANQLWCQHYGNAGQMITEQDHHEKYIKPIKAINGDNMVTNGESNYYYVDFPSHKIRVIMLNSTDAKFSEGFSDIYVFTNEQIEWFKNSALKTDYNVLVMTHCPLRGDFPNHSLCCTGGEQIAEAVEEFIAAGGRFIAYMYGHVHTCHHLTDKNERLHMSFKNGAHIAEVVLIDTDKKTIDTVYLGGEEADRHLKF